MVLLMDSVGEGGFSDGASDGQCGGGGALVMVLLMDSVGEEGL